jgi:photosystem II stability/assembly factor-like uncharacterized protein
VSPSREAADTPYRRAGALGALAALAAVLALPPAAAAPRAAEPARLASQSLLIAIAQAGERLVAVGDRGIIVLSDDHGASWRQADSVPVDVLLTGVCFLDAQHGVAVGHDEVVLVTADAGRSWKLTHYAPQAERPLLDVWCGSGARVIAVGAYRAYLVSGDGGLSFSAGNFTPLPRPQAPHAAPRAGVAAADEGAGGGDHLNRIVGAAGERLYIAAEAGHLYRSDDGGGHWQELASPYEGSFFDVLPLAGDAVLAFGLRGNLYRSEDAGASWRRIPTGTVAMLDGGASLGGDAVAIVGFAGVVLLSRDGGRSFTPLQQSDRSGLSAAQPAGDARLAVVGEAGARLIALGAAP